MAYEVIWDFDAMLDDRGVANKKLAADYQGCRMGGIPLTYTNPKIISCLPSKMLITEGMLIFLSHTRISCLHFNFQIIHIISGR